MCEDGITNPYAQFPDPYHYCDCSLGQWWKKKLDAMTFEVVSYEFRGKNAS